MDHLLLGLLGALMGMLSLALTKLFKGYLGPVIIILFPVVIMALVDMPLTGMIGYCVGVLVVSLLTDA